jgi:hypothetical protein
VIPTTQSQNSAASAKFQLRIFIKQRAYLFVPQLHEPPDIRPAASLTEKRVVSAVPAICRPAIAPWTTDRIHAAFNLDMRGKVGRDQLSSGEEALAGALRAAGALIHSPPAAS